MRVSVRLGAAALALGLLVPAGAVRAADRPAEEILKEIDGLKPPKVDRSKVNDRAYVMQYSAEARKVSEAKAKLIGELYRSHPDNVRVPALLAESWSSPYALMSASPDELIKQTEAVLARTKDEKLQATAHFTRARAFLTKYRENPAEAMPAVDAFLKAAPADRRAASLLYSVARGSDDVKFRTGIEERILKDFPDSPYVGAIKGARKQRESIGKPFDLEFNEAITGKTISMKDLKGKVVVVDFWATWCGPCVAEMPKMKKLYAEFKEKGVEFVGVSLDQPEAKGGLKSLKEFVAKNEIGWPQYYQGNYWQSEFSSSWGIHSIPAVFVVDQAGKLYSVEARGKLETIIPELLKKGQGVGGQ